MNRGQLILAIFFVLPAISLAQEEKKTDGLSKTRLPLHISQKLNPVLSNITANKILAHIQMLASDSFEGRAPGTKGETLTTNYLINQFKKTGVKPGNPDGTFLQEVKMVSFRPQKAVLSYENGNQKTQINFPQELIVESFRGHLDGSVKNSEVVFAGYGIVAPEYGWDDYKNINVKGKIVIVLSGEPFHKVISDTSKTSTVLLNESSLGYYGLRVYKYSVAEKKGAAALLIAHHTQTSYSFKAFQTAMSEQMDLKEIDNNTTLKAQGILSWNAFDGLCKAARVTADSLMEISVNKNFYPVRLGIKASIEVESNQREIKSYNVVAMVNGSDKKLKNEYVAYTAHWDHLGKDTTLKGDQIYNGAFDNALGVASLLEVAAGFAKLKLKPKRSILFIATTAEETRWRGAMYYTTHPLYPLSKTVVNINLDGFANPWGKTKEVGAGGADLSTLEDEIEQAAVLQDRVYIRKPEYSNFFFRSDAFEFAKAGIPAITLSSMGTDVVGERKGNGTKSFQDYFAQDYHKSSDEIKPGWNLSGAAQDAQLLLIVGYQIAHSRHYPQWKAGTVFKTIREKTIKNNNIKSY